MIKNYKLRKSGRKNLWFGVFLVVCLGSGLLAAEEEGGVREEALTWYKENFILWKACHDELESKLGENIKRDKAYVQRTIVTLEKLREVLDEEKKAEIQTYIDRYKEIARYLEERRLRRLDVKWLKRTLGRLRREVGEKFSYKVVEIKDKLIKGEEAIDSNVRRLGRSAPPTKEGKYRYVAGRKSKTFHRTMCIYVSKIREDDRLYFETKKEAEKSGRRPCRKCTR